MPYLRNSPTVLGFFASCFPASNSLLNSQDLMLNGQVGLRMNRESNVQETIQSIFTPEDVVITETLYCLWLAE